LKIRTLDEDLNSSFVVVKKNKSMRLLTIMTIVEKNLIKTMI